MDKSRLEAFSDGVIAVIITVMVLEMKTPQGTDFSALKPLFPVLISYLLSFVYVGIYWTNHHHLLQASHKVNGRILWANLHLLFWLSLVPFLTSWLGVNPFAAAPVALYGVVLLMCGVAYSILARSLIHHQGKSSALATAIGSDFKGNTSVVLYAVAIPLSFLNPAFAYAIYVTVALMWIVPDRRIEKKIE